MNRGDQARKISIMQCEMIERDNHLLQFFDHHVVCHNLRLINYIF